VLAAVLAVAAVPLAGLLWRLGQAGRPLSWSLAHAWAPLAKEATLYGGQMLQSLGVALVTGAGVAALALAGCWLAAESPPLRAFLLALLTFAWVLPGPIVGIGLKQTILALVQYLPDGPWTDLLYRGPSPLPIVWAHTIRFLPVAMFFLWPVVRLVPRELRDSARLAGARPLSELLHLVWPLTRGAVLLTSVAIAALCVGDVGASGRVETPNWEPFAKLILDRMHYGIDSNVAALSVLLLAGLGALAGGVAMVRGAYRSGGTNRSMRWFLASSALCLIPVSSPTMAQGADELPADYYHDFRGRPLPAEWTPVPGKGEGFLQFEPEGLRLTLPKNYRHPPGGVGVKTLAGLRGDFEVTATVEILNLETPPKGSGAGVGVAVDTPTKSEQLRRVVGAKGNHSLLWTGYTPPSPDKKGQIWQEDRIPCEENLLRLRFKRTGTVMHYLWGARCCR
jgi:ABC-type spermidine/putrescine transport system permease subunit II